ncbi:hypothetical protein SAMN04488526_2171 [Jannaschia helgolandensis]|jgi:hypothetical protein|uniref:Uncharacterized protein n=1 Tax=Jannaschia helgolandensis TaxID=188906 RepID=A0A1H7N4V8_9RHOB|nr:hypothetical protein SAMN04488526_2171 [Jannaschia helgolandensis]
MPMDRIAVKATERPSGPLAEESCTPVTCLAQGRDLAERRPRIPTVQTSGIACLWCRQGVRAASMAGRI